MRLLAVLFLGILWAQGWNEGNIQAALAKARKAKKPLWIFFTISFCEPCRVLEEGVLAHPSFQKLLQENFVPLKVSVRSGQTADDSLAEVYSVSGFPTFLAIEPTGEVFYRKVGYFPSANEEEMLKKFLQEVETAKQRRAQLAEWRRRFQKGDRSLNLLRDYLEAMAQLGPAPEVKKVFDAYLTAAKSVRIAWLGAPGYAYILSDLCHWGEPFISYALQIADTLAEELSSSMYAEIYLQILRTELGPRLFRQSSWEAAEAEADSFIRQYRTRFPFVEKLALNLLLESPLAQMAPEKAELLRLRLIATEWPLEIPDESQRAYFANLLNNAAWRFYTKDVPPDKLWVGITWAKYALSLQPHAWYIWDTLGALYYKLGIKREAISALEKAIALAKEQAVPEEEYSETIELLERARQLPD